MGKKSGSTPSAASLPDVSEPLAIRRAAPADLPVLLDLMRDFYQFEQIPFRRERLEPLLQQLIAEPALGDPMLLLAEEQTAGYFMLSWCFNLEFGGRFALLDELYIAPAFRSRGRASRAIQAAIAACRERGISALRLEISDGNAPAERLYHRHHFRPDRRLMTLRLDEGGHP